MYRDNFLATTTCIFAMLKLTSVILFLTIAMDTWHYVLLQDGSSNSPFNQGNNLYETPYSHSVMSMSAGRPMMTMVAGTGSMMGLGSRNGPLSWPSQFFHRGSHMTYTCIKGDIVCPVYCLVEDKNGCKSCPCAPANGMGVPVTSGHVTQMSTSPDKGKQTTDCIATIICMLSCKTGYKLGPKGQDGCQTCSCSKNESKDSNTNPDKPKNGANSGGQSSPSHTDNMPGGSSLMFGSGSGSGTGSLYSNTNSKDSKNDTNSGMQSSLFHISKMPGGSSGSFGSGSGSGTASASGAGMPSPFSTGSGSGSGGMGGSGGSNSGGFNPMFPGAGMTADGGSGMGMGGGGGGDGSSGSGSGCSGPFCSSTSSQNSGSGTGSATGSSSGAGMPSPFSTGTGSNSGGSNSGGTGSAIGSSSGAGMPSPFSTGSNSGGMGGSGGSNTGGMTGGGAVGGTGSGSKCTGPACSATNGETLLSKIPTVTGAPTGTRCPNTDLCVQTCKYTVKLGPAGSDGCHSCACVMKEETRPQQNLCNKVVQCILNCKTGYEVGNSKDQDGCPSCVCHQPPTPAPTEAPVQSSCDVTTLACMTRCRYGYNIQNAATSQCPVCKCLPAPTTPAPTTRPGVYSVLQNCPAAVHCMTSCSHGYSMVTRPGEACPICTCNTVTVSNVECATPLSCPRGCKVGYKCGTDGCPVCECIRPAEVGATLTSTYLTASLVCSAHFTCINRCPFGYQTGHNGCPSCQCLEPVTGHLSTIGTVSTSAGTENFGHVVQHSVQKWSFSQILKSCQNVLQCVATCTSGFEITAAPAGSCPDCLCKAKTQITTGSVTNAITGSGHGSSQTGIAVVPAAVVVPATEQHIPHLPSLGGSAVTGTGNSIHSAGNNIGNLPSVGAGHGGTGSHGAGGGPMAGATDCLGPACSAPNGLHVLGNGHPKKLSPNQCANVLTCVMTCTYGYKLGAMANNGCPQCECLQ